MTDSLWNPARRLPASDNLTVLAATMPPELSQLLASQLVDIPSGRRTGLLCSYDGCSSSTSGSTSSSPPNLRCSRCKAAFYCSETCQRAAWKTHKKVCVDSATRGTDGTTSGNKRSEVEDAATSFFHLLVGLLPHYLLYLFHTLPTSASRDVLLLKPSSEWLLPGASFLKANMAGTFTADKLFLEQAKHAGELSGQPWLSPSAVSVASWDMVNQQLGADFAGHARKVAASASSSEGTHVLCILMTPIPGTEDKESKAAEHVVLCKVATGIPKALEEEAFREAMNEARPRS